MQTILICLIVGLIVVIGLATMLFVTYFIELKNFENEKKELEKKVDYYINELRKRSGEEDEF